MLPSYLLAVALAGQGEVLALKSFDKYTPTDMFRKSSSAQRNWDSPLPARVEFPPISELFNFDKEIKDLDRIIADFDRKIPEDAELIRKLEAIRDRWKEMKEKYKDK